MASYRAKSLTGIIAAIAISGTSCFLQAQAPAKIQEIRGEAAQVNAAASVVVSQTDFVLNETPSRIEKYYSYGPGAMWDRFVNTPDEQRFTGLLSEGGDKLWQLFSQNLVTTAKKKGFDSATLEASLNALNYGRNRETAHSSSQPINSPIITPETTEEEKQRFAAEEEERIRKADAYEKYRNENIEEFYPHNLAIVPIGAHLANHPEWAMLDHHLQMGISGLSTQTGQETNTMLGHVNVWAMDTKTQQVLAFVSCD